MNGCPTTQRSGCVQPDWITLIVMPEELEARIAGGGRTRSMCANSSILNASRSGPFSWTRSAPARACSRSVVNRSRESDAPVVSPNFSRAGQAVAT